MMSQLIKVCGMYKIRSIFWNNSSAIVTLIIHIDYSFVHIRHCNGLKILLDLCKSDFYYNNYYSLGVSNFSIYHITQI